MPPVAVQNAPGIPGAPPRTRPSGPPMGAGRRGPSQDGIVDKFVAENLASDLMKMAPEDGVVEDGAHNWVLGGAGTDVVLIDARVGGSVKLAKALPRAAYKGTWFDPATGESKDAGTISGAAGVVTQKPDEKELLLLLKAA